MSDNKHISKSEFYEFQKDLLNQTDKIKFLEHICTCDYCADQFAELMSEDIVTAPRNMKENILAASKRPEVQLVVKFKATSKRMQLFIYSLKVGTATICALLLLMLTMNYSNVFINSNIIEDTSKNITLDEEAKPSLASSLRDGMDNFSNTVLDFSNNIMKTEVTDND